VVQEGDRRCKKSTLNDLAYLTPLRIPLMNPVIALPARDILARRIISRLNKYLRVNAQNFGIFSEYFCDREVFPMKGFVTLF
jgi:hypothetical protein